MKLLLERNESNRLYELRWGDKVLSSSPVLSQVVDTGKRYAKNFRKRLYLGASCVADWYIGFPTDREQAPVVFLDQHFMPETIQAETSPYRFVEGPFLSEQDAVDAAVKISGKEPDRKG